MKTKVTKSKDKFGADDWDLEDDDIEGVREWDLQAKLSSNRYSSKYLLEFENGEGFDLRYVQRNGIRMPLKFHHKTGLGIRVPSTNFNVNDVKQCVGARRLVDVMDVRTQKAIVMTMRDWCRYFNSPIRDRLLNVISLEFSHTKLDNYVESPTVVRQIDWLDRVWPLYLRELQTSSTNAMATMMYPKVRKYVLMSVKGSYTDFHVDFGGTSVWYHILRGEKVFWLIPPTEKNMRAFEEWSLSGNQSSVFFPDMAEGCERVHLTEGNTFFIPPGWIHGVFTPEDSLVFGGNFLHTFGVRHQLRVWELEHRTHVKLKFRYPYFIELHWYALARYVACLLHVDYIVPVSVENFKKDNPEKMEVKSEKKEEEKEEPNGGVKTEPGELEAKTETIDCESVCAAETYNVKMETLDEDERPLSYFKNLAVRSNCFESDEKFRIRRELLERRSTGEWVHLSKLEVENLQLIISWLKRLLPSRWRVPEDIKEPKNLLRDAQLLVNAHKDDDFFGLAISGIPVLRWPPVAKPRRAREPKPLASPLASSPGPKEKDQKGPMCRRIRCRRCEPCRRAECRECHFCLDMAKFNGPGVMKKCCVQKQCLAPQLPGNALCSRCGRMTRATEEERESEDYDQQADIFECGICWDVAHPKCLYLSRYQKPEEDISGIEGVLNEDLPNYWQCPVCVKLGRGWGVKSRVPKGLLFLRALETAAMEGGPGAANGEGGGSEVARILSGRPRGKVGRPPKKRSPPELSPCADAELGPSVSTPPVKKRGRPRKMPTLVIVDSPPVLQREPLERPPNPSPAPEPPFPLTASPTAPPFSVAFALTPPAITLSSNTTMPITHSSHATPAMRILSTNATPSITLSSKATTSNISLSSNSATPVISLSSNIATSSKPTIIVSSSKVTRNVVSSSAAQTITLTSKGGSEKSSQPSPTIFLSKKGSDSVPQTITLTSKTLRNASIPQGKPQITVNPKATVTLSPTLPPTITLSQTRAAKSTIAVAPSQPATSGPTPSRQTVTISPPVVRRPPSPVVIVHYVGPETAVTALESDPPSLAGGIAALVSKEVTDAEWYRTASSESPLTSKCAFENPVLEGEMALKDMRPRKERAPKKAYVFPFEESEDRFEERMILRTATRRFIQKPKRFIEEGCS